MRSQRHGLARVLSKLGWCSRSVAFGLIREGRVQVNGRVCLDPEHPTDATRDEVQVDGQTVGGVSRVYLMLNKPRGLVTTTQDERGRRTVYECLEGPPWTAREGKQGDGHPAAARTDAVPLPRVVPVGRLDQASEGLLLFTSDTEWAARVTDPASGIEKTYHVQVDRLVDDAFLSRMREGIVEGGERLTARRAALLRAGGKNSWLEVVLDEGRNRHLRRMMQASGVEVLRLVRVRIGSCELGELPKGRYRALTEGEVRALAGVSDRRR